MSKKLLKTSLLLFLVIITVMASGCELDEIDIGSDKTVKDTGRALICGSSYLIVYDDGTFLVMNDISKNKDLFSGIESGDKIEIYRRDEIAESYPAQCYVKRCEKIEDGNISDVPRKAIDTLTSIGWIVGSGGTHETKETDATSSTVTDNATDTEEIPTPDIALLTFDSPHLSDMELAMLINDSSEFDFDLLEQMTDEELREHGAEAGFGCYIIRMGQGVNITCDDGCESFEYDFVYTLTAYPDESDGGRFITNISSNSPYFMLCDISTGADFDKICENFRDKNFDVEILGEGRMIACRGGISISISKSGDEVYTNIHMTVTNNEGIIY